ncbi:MAG: response regulator [Pseudomonadota bacterium]
MQQILIIDDEKAILDVLRLALTRVGCEVEIAANGHQGIQKFDNGHFDVVITDIFMPGLNGNSVAQHIRNSNRPSTPIIGFSGTPWLLQEGDFDMVFTKPFPLKDLMNAVQDFSKKSSEPRRASL